MLCTPCSQFHINFILWYEEKAAVGAHLGSHHGDFTAIAHGSGPVHLLCIVERQSNAEHS